MEAPTRFPPRPLLRSSARLPRAGSVESPDLAPRGRRRRQNRRRGGWGWRVNRDRGPYDDRACAPAWCERAYRPQRRASTGRRSRDLGLEISGSRAGPDRAGQRGCLGLGYRSTAGLALCPCTAAHCGPGEARDGSPRPPPDKFPAGGRGGWRSVRLRSDAA